MVQRYVHRAREAASGETCSLGHVPGSQPALFLPLVHSKCPYPPGDPWSKPPQFIRDNLLTLSAGDSPPPGGGGSHCCNPATGLAASLQWQDTGFIPSLTQWVKESGIAAAEA